MFSEYTSTDVKSRAPTIYPLHSTFQTNLRRKTTFLINHSRSGWIYADHIDIHNLDKNNTEKNLNIVYQEFQDIELKINLSKINTITLDWNESSDDTYIDSNIKVSGCD